MSDRRLILCLAALALAACELIVDFDSEGAADPRLEPTPIPPLDGAVAVVVDARVAEGSVIKVPSDAGSDGGADASDGASDGAVVELVDASMDAALDATTMAEPDAAEPAGDTMDGAIDFADSAVDDGGGDAAPPGELLPPD